MHHEKIPQKLTSHWRGVASYPNSFVLQLNIQIMSHITFHPAVPIAPVGRHERFDTLLALVAAPSFYFLSKCW